MVDNQHRLIPGYRELNPAEIALMARIKEQGKALEALLAELAALPTRDKATDPEQATCDQRWLAIAKTDLQKGGMALTRSVAQPTFFF